MKRMCVFFLSVVLSQAAFPGVVKLTHHSRGNCINNESISWHLGHRYWFWINSEHFNERTMDRLHYDLTNWQYTWRAAAVCWGEGNKRTPGETIPIWTVHGTHWMRENPQTFPYMVAEEWVDDCSGYDGWWDH